GITILTTEERDARNANEAWFGNFDRVLCDVPCSGFGVFAKKPELRYKDPAASEALPDIQLAILKNASNYVKVGGKLVYSTCTLLPAENEENVSRFLSENNCFELKEQRTLYPDIDGTDGFFYAVMERVK
ncbi:MAG: 16S rRNA (cytosine(967)-C(5))-methyltransferase RsmB, partial [Clostridia bacterium]|nr:16S rRNA (cytosine(967)-C(5))-methyltransferase RsmB [Clostridia bacterium]